MSLETLPDPPPAPEVRRRIRLYPYQWVGLIVLASMPVLAVAGTFGESREAHHGRSAGLDVVVRYPGRMRYKQQHQIEIQLRNVATRAYDTVWVTVDSALLARFSDVRAIPPFTRAFEVPVVHVAPGESRLVLLEVQAEQYGHHDGVITVAAGDTVRSAVAVRVFP